MKVIYGAEGNNRINRPSAVGLGTFDGLHIGHMSLINTLVSESRLLGLCSIVYTFSSHPDSIIKKKPFTSLITLREKKIELLSETKLNYLYFEDFNEKYARMEPEVFVKSVLVEKLKVKLVVAGFNYRFGYKGKADVNLLKKLGDKYGFRVVIIPRIRIDNEIISSTIIRNYIKKGNMDRVFKMLGRHYSITGKVITGKQVGYTLGFPTANIYPEDYMVVPSNGVYITCTLVNGKLFDSITNIGVAPTVGSLKKSLVETHLINKNINIYDEIIEVYFIVRIRDEKKFINKDELVQQISKDISITKRFFCLYQ